MSCVAGYDPGATYLEHMLTANWIHEGLSAPRFERYLQTCDGNQDLALSLYELNTRLGLEIMRDIAYFEIALRNAYDRNLMSFFGSNLDWLLDPQSPIKRKNRETDRGRSRDSVLANLNFGFWCALTSAAYEQVLWVPVLHTSFNGKIARHDVHAMMNEIRILRNRVAHHEPIFNLTHTTRIHRDLIFLFEQVQYRFAKWALSSSEVNSVLAIMRQTFPLLK